MSDPGPTPDELAQMQDAAPEGKASEDDRGVEEGPPVADELNTDAEADEADLFEQSQEVPEDEDEEDRR